MKKEKSFYEQTLSAIFTHIADGALIVDKQGKVLEMNDALQRMTGWLPEDLVGKQICHALFGCKRQDVPGQESCCPGFKFTPVSELYDVHQARMLVTKTGKTIHAWISYTPLPDMRPESPAAIVLIRDGSEDANLENRRRFMSKR